MQGSAPASHITGVPGWETYDEQELLQELAMKVPADGVILEIGGEFGMSSSIFAKASPPTTRVYSVDIRYAEGLGDQHKANLQEAGLADRVVLIAGDSQQKQTVTKFKKLEKQIDLLFIDGDHSIQGALNDLNLWTPLVPVGGSVALHDCANSTNRMPHLLHFDVTRALALFMEKEAANWQATHMVNTMIVFRRTK